MAANKKRQREDDHATHPDDIGGRARPRFALCPRSRNAQGWPPTRPIKMICPFPAGGGTDLIAPHGRQASDRAARPAGLCREPRRRQRRDRRAGGDAGRAGRLHHRRDLGLADDRSIRALYEQAAYKPLRDFIPVATDQAISRRCWPRIRRTGIKTVADLIKLAKEKPGTLELFLRRRRQFQPSRPGVLALQTGIKIVHVPYRGVGPATHGGARRRSAAHVQQRRDRAASTSRPARSPASRSASRAALAGAAGRADRRRDRAGLRRVAVGRHLRAGQDAEGDRRAAEQGGRRDFLKDPEVVKNIRRPDDHGELSRQRAVRRS